MKPSMSIGAFREALGEGRLSRRDVTRVLASVGIATVGTSLVPAPARAEGWLQLFTWSGYDIPELFPAFHAKYGKLPDVALYADNDEAFNKVRAGYQADIVCPSNASVQQWIDAGLLEPLDTARLPNWAGLFDQFKGMRGTTGPGGEIYYAPWSWGNSSIVFRTDLAPEYAGRENHTWKILWDQKYAGKIAFRDNWAGTTIPAALVLGLGDPWHMTDEDIEKVREALIEQRPLTKFYWTSEADAQQAVASGELVAMYAWNSAYAALKKEGVPVEYMIPKEGLLTWADGHVLMKTHIGSDEERYDFLDATLSVETGKYMIETYNYGATNRESFAVADPAVIESLGMSDPVAVLDGSLWYETVPPDIKAKLVNVHDEVMAGS
jgi:spermidine/putrescine transport system substrate-binding protein